MFGIRIDEDLCTQCGLCGVDCVRRVFGQDCEGRVVVADEAQCLLCGHCVAVCPTGAISHEALGQDGFEEIDETMRVEPRRLRAFLRTRRSVRAYMDRPVPRPVIEDLIETARWVPTASNAQNVAFTVVQDPATLRLLSDRAIAFYDGICHQLADPSVAETLAASMGTTTVERLMASVPGFQRLVARYRQGEPVILRGAPALLLAHAETADYFGRDNCLFATYNFMLGATARGLGTCLIGYLVRALHFNPSIAETVGLPPDHTVHAACVFGYPRFSHQRLVPRNPIPTRWL